ncbi:MAG: hypothetical protein LBT51_00940 [Fusobacteriaceae bacterium]|nr:hypothetical protein [Fusobacteriaceae bacterium]
MKNELNVEKEMKRFLKRKVTFVAGLIVSFLITGFLGFAQKENVISQLDQGEKVISNLEETSDEENLALLGESEAKKSDSSNLKKVNKKEVNRGNKLSKNVKPILEGEKEAKKKEKEVTLNENMSVDEYTSKLEEERVHITQLLQENEVNREQIWTDYQELIRKGDFYSKPILLSTQIFFTIDIVASGMNKDGTKNEWKSIYVKPVKTTTVENPNDIVIPSDDDESNTDNDGSNINNGGTPPNNGETQGNSEEPDPGNVVPPPNNNNNVPPNSGDQSEKDPEVGDGDDKDPDDPEIGNGEEKDPGDPEIGNGEEKDPDDPEIGDGEDKDPEDPEVGDGGNKEPEDPEVGDGEDKDPEDPEIGDGDDKDPEDPEVGDGDGKDPEDPEVGDGDDKEPEDPEVGDGEDKEPEDPEVGDGDDKDPEDPEVGDGDDKDPEDSNTGKNINVGANVVDFEVNIPNLSNIISIGLSNSAIAAIAAIQSESVKPGNISMKFAYDPEITIPTIISPETDIIEINGPGTISVKLDQKIPVVSEPNFNIPSFDTKLIEVPSKPIIHNTDEIIPDDIFFESTVNVANESYSWTFNDNKIFHAGIISQLSINSGKIEIEMGDDKPATAAYKIKTTGFNASDLSGNLYNADYDSEGKYVGGGYYGIYQMVGAPYAKFESDTNIIIDSKARPLDSAHRVFIFYSANIRTINLEEIEKLASDAEGTFIKDNLVRYDNVGTEALKQYQILSLRGNITVDGNKMIVMGITPYGNQVPTRAISLNSGNISLTGNGNIAMAYLDQVEQGARHLFMANWEDSSTGKIGNITLNGNNNIGVYFGGGLRVIDKIYDFKNTGTMKILDGQENIGLYLQQSTNNGYIEIDNPIEIKGGIKNIGVYQKEDSYYTQYVGGASVIRSNKMNENSYLKVSITGGSENIGYYGKLSQKIASHGFEIGGEAIESVGVFTDGGDLDIGTGKIKITGGEKNIGIYAANGNVTTAGDIDVSGGRQNSAVYVEGTESRENNVTIDGDVNAKVDDSVIFYAVGNSDSEKGTIKINGDLNIELTASTSANTDSSAKERTIGFFADSYGSIDASRTELSNDPNIVINGGVDAQGKQQGSAVYVKDSGFVNLSNNNIKVIGGSTAIISVSSSSQEGVSIDLSSAKIEYNGNGIALYAPYNDDTNSGKIKMEGATLILDGNATGWEENLTTTKANPIDFGTADTKMKLIVNSDDVTIVNLKNADDLKVSELIKQVNPSEIVVDGESTATNYKWAMVDGGAISIDIDIDKTSGDTTEGGFYTKRFVGQRQNLTLEAGKTITAILDNEDAAFYGSNVFGLSMNSSQNGKGLSWRQDTSITLKADSELIVDGTEAGIGSIGAYINYGEFTNDGIMEVEVDPDNEANVVNAHSVGVYAVNGSTVANNENGIIAVAGAESIGIFAKAYRNDTDIHNEYGQTTDEGHIEAINSGKIDMTVDSKNNTKNIGIYAKNNNSAGGIETSKIVNEITGYIKVGDDQSVGIYSEGTNGSEIINKGTIEVGDKGSIGIYATNGSHISSFNDGVRDSFGKFILGNGSTAILINDDSTLDSLGITASGKQATINLESTSSSNKGAIGIAILKDNFTSTPYIVNINSNDKDTYDKFVGGTIFYTENMILSSNGELYVAGNGTGIFAKNSIVANSNDFEAGKEGKINLSGDKSFGLYTENGILINRKGAEININGSSQIAMAAKGIYSYVTVGTPSINGGFIYNEGSINIDSDNGIGIYAADGASVALNGNGIVFGGKNSYGVFANNGSFVGIGTATEDTSTISTEEFAGVIHNPDENDTGNILVVAQSNEAGKGANVINDDLTVGNIDGSAEKTIGIYLDGNGNTYEDIDGNTAILTGKTVYGSELSSTPSLKVYGGAIGVYSRAGEIGDNNRLLLDAEVKGNQSVGAYLNGSATISGYVISSADSGNAIGIYGTIGTITIEDADSDGNGLTLTLGDSTESSSSGTGIYLDKGAIAVGEKITLISNNSSKTSTGIYYDGVTGTHDTDILLEGSNIVGIFANNGANITYSGSKNIEETTVGSGTGENRYAVIVGESYATGGSSATFTNAGKIKLSSANSIAIYTENGIIVNNGTINTTGTKDGTEGAIVVGANDGATSDTVYVQNNGTINVKNSLGILVDSRLSNTTGIITNVGTINVENTLGADKASVGVVILGDSTSANITYNGTGSGIKVKGESAGYYLKNTADSQVSNVGNINLIDAKSVGVYADDSVVDFDIKYKGTGIGLYLTGASGSKLTGDIDATEATGGIAVYVNDSKSDISGTTIDLGTNVIGLYLSDDYILSNTTINATANGSTGIYVNGGKSLSIGADTSIVVGNDSFGESEGAIGIYLNGNDNVSNIDTNNGTITVNGNGIGIYAKGNIGNINLGETTVNKGIGVILESTSSSTTLNGTITLNSGVLDNYTIGSYLLNPNGTVAGLPNTNYNGNYMVGTVIEGGNSTITSKIETSTIGTNQIGVFIKNNVSTTFTDSIDVKGSENIGIFTLGDSSKDIINYVKVKEDVNFSAGSYGIVSIDSDVVVGDASNIVKLDIEDNAAAGIVSLGKGDIDVYGLVDVADKDITETIRKPSAGIYKENGEGKITTYGGDTPWNIGKGGYGIYVDNETYEGAGVVDITNHADINLKEGAIGIFARGNEKTDPILVENNGIIDVGSTYLPGTELANHKDGENHLNSIGIYIGRGVSAENTSAGIINVKADHSVGVYLDSSSKLVQTTFTNNGTINVDNGGVGVLARGNTKVINNGYIITGDGIPICEVENGQNIGIAAYGLDAEHKAIIINGEDGVIKVGEGTGIYIGNHATFLNEGEIIIDNGIGIQGKEGFKDDAGIFVNKGIIKFLDSDSGGAEHAYIPEAEMFMSPLGFAADGTILLNKNFIQYGTLAGSKVFADGVMVSIVGTDDKPMFIVDEIEGTIKLLPDFITTGNGYGWEIINFISYNNKELSSYPPTERKIEINASPLFTASVDERGTLTVIKEPYSSLVTGSEFNNLYDSVDSLLMKDSTGLSNDSQLLKRLNSYLYSINDTKGADAFNSELNRTLAEMRGDIYATMQNRIQDVQHTFDNSFEELIESYNFTRETNKYSVMYRQGNFRDNTVGIDDYNYRVQGLLYMKEFEGMTYGNKWGYLLGFAVSRFDFDDAPTFHDKSKEDMYSVRAGFYNVHSFDNNDRMRLISRLEFGYNRHETERTLELDKVYKNKGSYDSYIGTLDNRLEATVYRSISAKVELYAALNLEYVHINGFTEKAKDNSGITLDVKGEDYFSAVGEVGINGSKRIYLGKKISTKLEGSLAYLHEFGNNHDRNKTRVNGSDGEYSNLIRPAKEKGAVVGKIGVTFEKRDHYGITFEVEVQKHQNKKDTDVKYGIRLNCKF